MAPQHAEGGGAEQGVKKPTSPRRTPVAANSQKEASDQASASPEISVRSRWASAAIVLKGCGEKTRGLGVMGIT